MLTYRSPSPEEWWTEGKPIRLIRTLSAEHQRSLVESAIDYILVARLRKQAGLSYQEWWKGWLRETFEGTAT